MTTKPWFKSRLLWLGVTAVMTAAVNWLATGDTDPRNLAIGALGALVVILRPLTTTRLVP